jgi:hypothetical protein
MVVVADQRDEVHLRCGEMLRTISRFWLQISVHLLADQGPRLAYFIRRG